ncbi:nucleolar protein 6 [Leptidea sinapis]|uniref:nucleolar protein 6 n=1 Tax=Leptidea sinapis TaxID=189913 RepID=UPI0021C3F479|nr:nucleolar protein 6 [Leptidea sinapis]
MVKRDCKLSIFENEAETNINENGKRPIDDPKKEGKKRIKNLYRQPTAKELNRLQETENLFNSNLFRLQIDEVLQEVKVKEKTDKRFIEWFTNLKTHLLTIADDEQEYILSEKTLAKHLKVKLPISPKLSKTKAIFKFFKFHDIDIVGSYALNNSINSKLIVDVLITVPACTYTKNDSINYRYHQKRAAYLAYIASHLRSSDLIEDLKYSYSDSISKPFLILKPSGKLGNSLSVKIDLCCEEDAYKLHRFSPSRNNLRDAWYFGGEDTSDVGTPTPYYNCSVLADLTAKLNHEFLTQTLKNCENLKQAIVLLKIWARQRGLRVNGYILSMLVSYLVQLKRINNIMSSYQIVRNVWIYLKTSDWDTNGVTLNKLEGSPQLEEFAGTFPVVFLDKTGFYNICWNMDKGTYNSLRRESSLAVDMLDNPKLNSFIPLFMVTLDPLMQFEYILRFKNLNTIKELVYQKVSKENKLNYGIDDLSLIITSLHSLMSKGLQDRVHLILPLVEANFSWPVKMALDKAQHDFKEKLSFGFVMNPENALNLVDRGPPANLPEAEQFRLFWGDKSELRRFQDADMA